MAKRNTTFPILGLLICALQTGCDRSVQSTPNPFSQERASLTAKAVGQTKFKLHEIASLPSQGLPGTVRLYFLNEREGWLHNFNHLWHTSDGGRRWDLLSDVSSDINAGFQSVQFTDAQVGWRCKISSVEGTKNGGLAWSKVRLPFKPDEGIVGAVHFLSDGRRGWLSGGLYRPINPSQAERLSSRVLSADETKALQGVIFYTEDSGQHWRPQPIQTELGELVGEITTTRSGRA